MATGDVIWEATGGRLSANDWTRTDSGHATQTAAFINLAVTTPVSEGGHTYSASGVSLALANTNTTQNLFVLVPFDTNKQYTITVTEE